jgi:plasmid stabilization system protein ParE
MLPGKRDVGTALAYVERIVTYCEGLSDLPHRGSRRDDLWPGLRVIGFEKRVTIGFHVSGMTVNIDRILYGGRDVGTALKPDR